MPRGEHQPLLNGERLPGGVPLAAHQPAGGKVGQFGTFKLCAICVISGKKSVPERHREDGETGTGSVG
jgi:hypothetical protein